MSIVAYSLPLDLTQKEHWKTRVLSKVSAEKQNHHIFALSKDLSIRFNTGETFCVLYIQFILVRTWIYIYTTTHPMS